MYLMKINHIKGLACMSLALALASCTSGFEDINRPGGKLDKESLLPHPAGERLLP